MLFSFACEAAGAVGARLSLRSLFERGTMRLQKLGRSVLRERGCMSTSLRAKRSNPFCRAKKEWIASLLAMTAFNRLNRFPRIRHRRGQAAIDRDRLAIDIGRFVARKKQSHRGEFMRLARALERIELSDLVLGAALLGIVEDRLGHAGFDQAGAHRIDAHAGARERIGRDLHEADDAGLAGA